MKKSKLVYNCINVIVMIITAILFFLDYRDVGGIFGSVTWFSAAVLIMTVVVVHLIKAFRLYLILYGSDIGFKEYMKIYCKTTPVSVLFPLKTGEFFRMYCHGKKQGNLLKGVVIILLDRFMDTIALVTMILAVWLINGGHVTNVVYFLIVFLVFVLLMYFAFPGVYKIWKKQIMCAKATKNKLAVLKLLEMFQLIYKEITAVSKGRGILLFSLSIVAWSAEIGSIAIVHGFRGDGKLTQAISDYLMAAMSGNQSEELRQFVFASVILMVCIYIIIKITDFIEGRRGSDDSNCL